MSIFFPGSLSDIYLSIYSVIFLIICLFAFYSFTSLFHMCVFSSSFLNLYSMNIISSFYF